MKNIDQALVKLGEQRGHLMVMQDEGISEFETARVEIHPEDTDTVLNSRIDIRLNHKTELTAKLRNAFGQKYDYQLMARAEEATDAALHEALGEISYQARLRELEQQQVQRHKRKRTLKSDISL